MIPKFGVYDKTVGMWIEKAVIRGGEGFVACRPEILGLTWTKRIEAEAVCSIWATELGSRHELEVKEVSLPNIYAEIGMRWPLRLNANADFPSELTEEMLAGFLPTKEGSTRPKVGLIGGQRFILKVASNTSREHIENEVFADAMIRAAGFRSPLSRLYYLTLNGRSECVRLSQYIDDAVALKDVAKVFPYWLKEVKDQVVDAYPLMAVMANVDAFHNDNVLVDRKGHLWFVDNGAALGFRARGKHKRIEEGFSYDWEERTDPDKSADEGGVMGLYMHSRQLQSLLGAFTRTDVDRALFRMVDIKNLVKSMPSEYKPVALNAYVAKLVARARPVAPGRKIWSMKYAYNYYRGEMTNPYDYEKMPTEALFWDYEHAIETTDGLERVVEWLFETSRPSEWPKFMQEATARRDELAIVYYCYENEKRQHCGRPNQAMLHNVFGVQDPTVRWEDYFED